MYEKQFVVKVKRTKVEKVAASNYVYWPHSLLRFLQQFTASKNCQRLDLNHRPLVSEVTAHLSQIYSV